MLSLTGSDMHFFGIVTLLNNDGDLHGWTIFATFPEKELAMFSQNATVLKTNGNDADVVGVAAGTMSANFQSLLHEVTKERNTDNWGKKTRKVKKKVRWLHWRDMFESFTAAPNRHKGLNADIA